MTTRFELRFFEADGVTPCDLFPETAEAVRSALASLTRAVAREVGMTGYTTVTTTEETP